MNTVEKFNSKSLFIVWGTPDQGPRSKVWAAKLDIDVHYIQTNIPGVVCIPGLYIQFRR